MESTVVKDELHQVTKDSARETAMKKIEKVRVRVEERTKIEHQEQQLRGKKILEAKLENKQKEYENKLEILAQTWFQIPIEAFDEFNPEERLAIESDVLQKAQKSRLAARITAGIGIPLQIASIIYLVSVIDPLFILLVFPFLFLSMPCFFNEDRNILLKNHKILNSENPLKELAKTDWG